MKTPTRHSNLVAVISLVAVALAISRFLFAADQKQARVTEVFRDVNLLASQAAARPAVVNDAVHSGTAVHTGTDSRAELTFTDLSLARLGANTVFTFGAGARTYDLGSGAVLMSAPPQAGTVKISTKVATCAVSGFTAILERHSNTWNKFILLHGDGYIQIHGLPADPCPLHTGQMVVFPPNPTHCPQVLNIDISKLLNGRLIKGFKNPLPELPVILADIKNQQNSPPPPGGFVDPTSIDKHDQAITAMPPEPMPRPTFPGKRFTK